MPHDKHHILLEEGEHPSLELLRQYHEDTLHANLSHQVEKHLLACELCTDVMEGMALSDKTQTSAAITDINQRITASIKKKRERTTPQIWQIAAAMLLLLCASVLVVYYNYDKNNSLQQEQGSIAVEQEVKKVFKLPTPLNTDSSVARISARDSSVTQSIAAAPSSENRTTRSAKVAITEENYIIDDVTPEELMPEMSEEEHERYTINVLEGIDTPSIANASPFPVTPQTSVSEATIASLMEVPVALPESTGVSSALEGKAAGVTIRGMSSLKKNDAATTKLIAGQVLGDDGQPLPGVTVRLRGTTQGVSTDENGKFILPVIGANPVLQFHFIGYESTEKAIAANTDSVNIAMAPNKHALSEVVVVGYGANSTAEAPAVIAATPEGGNRAYKKYLKEKLRIPAGSEMERGKVVVEFKVTSSGELKDVQVVKSLCPACDAEAIRLVKEGPSWQPATQAGSPIEQQVKVTVKFRGKSQ